MKRWLALLPLLAWLWTPAAQATCGAPLLISSVRAGGPPYHYSYVHTPGVDPATSVSGSSLSERVEGFFWALGFGDPAPGVGHDNGTLEPLGSNPWLYVAPGYPAFVLGTWAMSNEIDGCIIDTPIDRLDTCMAVLLTDQVDDVGYFIAITEKTDSSLNYFFNQPDNQPIVLAPIPPPIVLYEERVGPVDLAISVAPPMPSDGLILDTECEAIAAMPVGFRVYRQTLDADVPAPGDRAVAAGWGNPSAVTALDGEAVLSVPCDDDRVTWLATSLVFDSGFETPVVSANSAPIACRRCDVGADEDGDGACTETGGDEPTDCDDANSAVYPGAPQLCDGVENDCLNPTWPALPAGESDVDGDGHRQCAGDCADRDATRWPGAEERCNGLDDDCDTLVDENEDGVDSDGDGVSNVCDNCVYDINPGQSDLDTDGIGDTCDDCNDRDGDGWGDPGSPNCAAGAATDCDDLDWITLPGGIEYDDGKDNDCDTAIDEALDADGDGIPDFRDACAGTPPRSGVDPAGCDICPATTTDDPAPSRRGRSAGRAAEASDNPRGTRNPRRGPAS